MDEVEFTLIANLYFFLWCSSIREACRWVIILRDLFLGEFPINFFREYFAFPRLTTRTNKQERGVGSEDNAILVEQFSLRVHFLSIQVDELATLLLREWIRNPPYHQRLSVTW